MTVFFKENIDYIFFCYGLAFVILAAVCATLQKAEQERLPWRTLGLFGLTHGIVEWADLAALTFGDSLHFLVTRSILMLISFVFLMEFARDGGNRLRGRGPGQWILLLPLALAVAGGAATGWTGINTTTRYALGLPAGLWTANTLYRYAGMQTALARRLLIAASALTGFYALASGLIVPDAPFFPASLINGNTFFQLTGLPIQLIRALLAVGIAFLIYAYAEFPLLDSAERRFVHRSYRNLHRTFALVIAIILAAGWLVTFYMGRVAHRQVVETANGSMATLESHMSMALQEPERTVKMLALAPWISNALVTGNRASIDLANTVLDQYRETMGASVCYLLDRGGVAIASSNRMAPDSFVGRSYAFRHYFQSAAAGAPATQFALGVTSGERGYYASHPVLTPDGKTAGVAVIKQSMDWLEKKFPRTSPVFFISPEGIIFLSGNPETLFMALWPLPVEEAKRVIAQRQFGAGPFPPLLSREPQNGDEIIYQDRPFILMRKTLNRAGWSIVHFEKMEMVRFYRFMGTVITFTLCMLTLGLSVFFKNALQSTAMVTISEGRFRAIFENAPGAIFIVDEQTHRILQFNPFMKNWLGYQGEELLEMTLEDLRTAEEGDGGSRYRKKDGTLADVKETPTKVPFQKGEALLIIAHDISDHKQIEAILRDQSMRDGLTGLANRRYFDEYLEREWKRALREKVPLSVIMCDIDFFKNFNDTYGHQSGDDCLRAVARVLGQGLHRPLDIAARYGGEEFVVVIPGTPIPGAMAVAHTIRSGVEALAIPHASSSVAPVVTISLGVASVIPAPEITAEDLVAAADQALYRAKGGGRNRIST